MDERLARDAAQGKTICRKEERNGAAIACVKQRVYANSPTCFQGVRKHMWNLQKC